MAETPPPPLPSPPRPPSLPSPTHPHTNAAHGSAGGGASAKALEPPRPHHVAPQRYACAGAIHAFAGGAFDPADARAELDALRRPHHARVDTGLAAYDRSAGHVPWADRE